MSNADPFAPFLGGLGAEAYVSSQQNIYSVRTNSLKSDGMMLPPIVKQEHTIGWCPKTMRIRNGQKLSNHLFKLWPPLVVQIPKCKLRDASCGEARPREGTKEPCQA